MKENIEKVRQQKRIPIDEDCLRWTPLVQSGNPSTIMRDAHHDSSGSEHEDEAQDDKENRDTNVEGGLPNGDMEDVSSPVKLHDMKRKRSSSFKESSSEEPGDDSGATTTAATTPTTTDVAGFNPIQSSQQDEIVNGEIEEDEKPGEDEKMETVTEESSTYELTDGVDSMDVDQDNDTEIIKDEEEPELQNIVAHSSPTGMASEKQESEDINLDSLASNLCTTPIKAIDSADKDSRDSPGLWKSALDPVDFPILDTSDSNFILSEQIAASADSMTSESDDIAKLLGVDVVADAEQKPDNEMKHEEEAT